jgi:hypothetical protein
MPKVPTRRDPAIAVALAAWEEFEEPAAWRRSKRGNLWRLWGGLTVTVFERDDGYWGWCIADDEGQRYSRTGFEEAAHAMTALGEALGVGE